MKNRIIVDKTFQAIPLFAAKERQTGSEAIDWSNKVNRPP
jgi:hypothetical protein